MRIHWRLRLPVGGAALKRIKRAAERPSFPNCATACRNLSPVFSYLPFTIYHLQSLPTLKKTLAVEILDGAIAILIGVMGSPVNAQETRVGPASLLLKVASPS